MTTKNHSAFLMCPTSRTTHLGGTPLESGEAGGHIRKTWVHVAEAALLGLPEVVANDQALTWHYSGLCKQVDAPAQDSSSNEGRESHRAGGPLRGNSPGKTGEKRHKLKRLINSAAQNESFHGLGFRWLNGLSAGMVNQRATFVVWPALVLYAMPKPLFWEQHLAGQNGIAFALQSDGEFFRARAGTVGYVLKVATGRINLQGKSLTLFNAQALPISFKVHG